MIQSRLFRRLPAVFAALLVMTTGPGASAAVPAVSAVDGLQAAVSGGTLTVTGHAVFGGQSIEVATDDPGDGAIDPATASTAGVDLLSANIAQPDPTKNELVFEWKLTDYPSTPAGGVPEFTFYRWGLQIGTVQYVIQAKLTNFLSTMVADDPTGYPNHLTGAFQLRGGCGLVNPSVPVSSCHLLAWLQGEFDAANKTVRVHFPLGQSYAPQLVAGAVVKPYAYDAQAIAAGFTAAISNASTTDVMEWLEENAYTIAAPAVSVGIAPAGTDPGLVSYGPAQVGSDGSFTGGVNVSSLPAGAYAVYARACFGTNCGTSTTPVTL